MSKLHRTLHLQHHRHTGKLLHHRHTSYRGLAIVLGLAGLFMAGLNVAARVTADSLYVYARNPAPIPAGPAVITSPTDGTVFHIATFTVSGTCPVVTPRVIVAISDNGQEAGSVPCDNSNNFSISITVTPGQHTLVAKTYTITNDPGPDSDPVHITYIAPTPPTGQTQTTHMSTNASGTSTAEAVPPLILTIDEPFIIFGPGKDALWLGTIAGGKLPYRVVIDWGDGSTDTYTLTTSGSQHFRHHYKIMQPYAITFQVTDTASQRITRTYAAVTPYTPPAVGNLLTPRAPFGGSTPLGIYGLYLLLLAIFGWLWMREHPRQFAYAKVPAARRKPTSRRYAATKRRHSTSGGR